VNAHRHSRPVTRLSALSQAASGIVLIVGLMVLTGWLFDVSALKAVVPGLATMKPNTAMAFFLAGMSLWLLQEEGSGRWVWGLAYGCALAVALVGFLTLMEYLWRWDPGIDRLLFPRAPQSSEAAAPGRMSLTTALSFYMVGLALLLVRAGDGRNRLFVQSLIVATAAVSALALVGYAYGVESLYRVSPYGSMALHTALAFLLLCLGILCSCPECWLTATLFRKDASGAMARYWLAASIGVPFVLGWLGLAGLKAGFYDSVFGVALLTVAMMGTLIFVVLWSSRQVK
jgi:hypothetical protein